VNAVERWAAAGPGRQVIAFQHGGRSRPYLLQAPTAPLRAGQAPRLVLELHGRGIDPVRFDAMTGLADAAALAGAAVVLPAAVGEVWNDGRDPLGAQPDAPDDVAYLDRVAADGAARLGLAEPVVLVAGMSNGAAMAGRLAAQGATPLVAVAQVAGTGAVAAGSGSRARPLPLLVIHGTGDHIAPYEGGVRTGLRARAMIRRQFRPSMGAEAWAAA